MARVMVFVALLALALLCGGRARAQEIPNPFPADAQSYVAFPNGLRLVVREDHSLPIVAMVVVVRGGSGAEQDTRGIPHYLEHLVFQGTRQFPGALAPQYALEQVGGISNASTTRDATRFQATAPSDQIALLVRVLADIVQAPSLTDEAFAAERAVLLAEIQRENDHPVASLVNTGFRLTYRTHPYRCSSSGTVDEMLRLTAPEVRAFHDRWYVPNNMSVVLVGDVTMARAMDLVQQAFGEAKAHALPPRSAPEAPPVPPAQAHYPAEGDDTYQVMVFPAPAGSDVAGMVATDLLTTLLADGGGLLPSRWAADGVAVGDFGLEFVSSRDPGRMLVWARTAPRMAVKLRESTLALLRELHGTPLAGTLLLQAKQRCAAQFLLDNETYSQQAATLAFYEGVDKAELACRYIPTLQAVTAAQLCAVTPTELAGWFTQGQRPESGR